MLRRRYKLNISLAPKNLNRFYKGRLITAKSVQNSLLFSRIGVSISKRYSLKAVERNRIRRVIQAFFTENEAFLTEKQPYRDILISVLTPEDKKQDNEQSILSELKNVISI